MKLMKVLMGLLKKSLSFQKLLVEYFIPQNTKEILPQKNLDIFLFLLNFFKDTQACIYRKIFIKIMLL